MTTYPNWITFKVLAYSAKIAEQFVLNVIINKWIPVLCAKDYVEVVFN